MSLGVFQIGELLDAGIDEHLLSPFFSVDKEVIRHSTTMFHARGA